MRSAALLSGALARRARALSLLIGAGYRRRLDDGHVRRVPFTEAYLDAVENISSGGEIWADQCRHCHGAKAYPGKAPKLKPRRYKPDFVYRRVTDGFRKMPAWDEVYSDDERMQIVAYILSDKFSP
ncbi:MAG: cytochrome c [Pseudomonadota bacterium]